MNQPPTIPPVDQFHDLIWQMANYCWRRLPKGLTGVDPDDLYAEGLLAYVRFTHKFDPSRGYQFITGFHYCLRSHYADLLRSAWRKLPVFGWEEVEGGVMLEDLAVDHRAGSLKADILGDLSDIANRRLSRAAWLVVRTVLDPPPDFIQLVRKYPRLQVRTLLWKYLGFNKFARHWIEQEIKQAFAA